MFNKVSTEHREMNLRIFPSSIRGIWLSLAWQMRWKSLLLEMCNESQATIMRPQHLTSTFAHFCALEAGSILNVMLHSS